MNVPNTNFETSILAGQMLGLMNGQTVSANVSQPHSFESFLNAFLDVTETVGAMEAQAQQVALSYALGDTDDMLAVILAQESAFVALSFTVQITSRVMQAYQEIMRMQV